MCLIGNHNLFYPHYTKAENCKILNQKQDHIRWRAIANPHALEEI